MTKKKELRHTQGLRRDLMPGTEAVRSAVAYLEDIESFFLEKSNGQIHPYQLLYKTFLGSQETNVEASISGRLFNDVACYIKQNESKGIKQRETKEISAREKVKGKKKYDFVTDFVIDQIDYLVKSKNTEVMDSILQTMVSTIEDHPLWKAFWQKRNNTVGVNNELKLKILQSLVYKIAGDCHQAYIAKYKPSIDVQKAANNIINAFKMEALKVSSLAKTPIVEHAVKRAPLTRTEGQRDLSRHVDQLKNEKSEQNPPAPSQEPIQNARLSSQESVPNIQKSKRESVIVVKTTQEATEKVGRVQQMARDYEKMIKDKNKKGPPRSK